MLYLLLTFPLMLPFPAAMPSHLQKSGAFRARRIKDMMARMLCSRDKRAACAQRSARGCCCGVIDTGIHFTRFSLPFSREAMHAFRR